MTAWVQEDFGVALDTLDPVTGGADEAALLWRGTAAGGARYAVKLTGGGTPAGLTVSARLARHGVPGVAAPVPTRRGALWSVREERRLSLVPWVSDTGALDDGAMDAGHWRAYGALLARVHTAPVPGDLARLLPHERYDHAGLAAYVREVDHRLSVPDGGAGDSLRRAVAKEWAAAADRIAHLRDRADALARDLRARTGEPEVICHGDPHLLNVLLDEARGVWLVDWDDAVLAPRERDLMFVLGGVLPWAPVTARQQEWFFEGYGPAEPDPVRIAYYRCARALEDVAYPAAQAADAGRWPDEERARALDIVRAVLSPTGLVALALSSSTAVD